MRSKAVEALPDICGAIAWIVAAGVGGFAAGPLVGILLLGLGAVAWTVGRWARRTVEEQADYRRRRAPLSSLARQVEHLPRETEKELRLPEGPEWQDLGFALEAVRRELLATRIRLRLAAGGGRGAEMTRSGLYDSVPDLMDSSPDLAASGTFEADRIVARLDPVEFRWIDSSPAGLTFFGWPLTALRRMSFLDVVVPDDRELALDQFRAAAESGEAHGLVFRIRTARDEVRDVAVNIGVRFNPGHASMHLKCYLTDVTSKLRAERELRRRTRELTRVNAQLREANRQLRDLKDRYSDLFHNAPSMYFALNERGELVRCNDTMLRVLGYPWQDLIGQSALKVMADEHQESFLAEFPRFLERGSIDVETTWKKADGGQIDVWVQGTVAGATGEGSERLAKLVAQDITERRQLEKQLEERNRRLEGTNAELSRKNRELDEFSHVVSHDLQEPIRTLIAFSGFLLEDHSARLDPEGQEFLRYIIEASRRMRALIHDLLDLSRAGKTVSEFGPVNLNEVLARVVFDLSALIQSKGARIEKLADLPILWGDRDRLGQLVANLVGNGLKYNRSESPTVEVGMLEPESGGSLTTLFVRDNGIGIDPKFHAKIFQVFARLHTRDQYEGTGAGLAICRKIVQAHGGRIWVESQPDIGSTFFFTLPRAPEGRLSGPSATPTPLSAS